MARLSKKDIESAENEVISYRKELNDNGWDGIIELYYGDRRDDLEEYFDSFIDKEFIEDMLEGSYVQMLTNRATYTVYMFNGDVGRIIYNDFEDK